MDGTKHTPGPWQLASLTPGMTTGLLGPTRDKRLGTLHTGSDEYLLNAALIVAAPDLLEAVRELLATHPAAYRKPNPIDNRTDNAIRIARAAVANAEGRAP